MKYLLTSDLHFTDRPRDAYRFDLFPWLIEQVKKYEVDYVFILGDITDQKDNHSSYLVNRIVDSLEKLAATVDVIVLTGNHDFIDAECPFFRFLTKLDNITFITEIASFEGDDELLFLPYTKTPTEDWKDIVWSKFDYVFMHQTMDGSKASSGQMLDGLSRKVFKDYKGDVYSGDIHVPQTIGPVTYVGSPYHVHFGDHFIPRALLLEDNTLTELNFTAPRKLTYELTDPEELLELDFNSDDQLKVRLKLHASQLTDWSVLKHRVEEICAEREVYLHAVELLRVGAKQISKPGSKDKKRTLNYSPLEAYEQYCKKEKIKGPMKEAGKPFLEL